MSRIPPIRGVFIILYEVFLLSFCYKYAFCLLIVRRICILQVLKTNYEYFKVFTF